MLNVKIEIDDGQGKKATLEICESDRLSKLVVIQNVFNLFGINNDILEITNTFNKIGAAYSSFFNETESIEPVHKNENIEHTLTKAYEENKDEIETTYTSTGDQPEHLITGIKTREDGKQIYRCRYHCYACYTRSNMYIYENTKRIYCHNCRHELTVYPANPEGFPKRDFHGNFFRAGDYRDKNIVWNEEGE